MSQKQPNPPPSMLKPPPPPFPPAPSFGCSNWIGEGERHREANRKEAERLRALGYSLYADCWGYKVSIGSVFVHAASVLGRPKMHWRHRISNRRSNFFQALRAAQRHEKANQEVVA